MSEEYGSKSDGKPCRACSDFQSWMKSGQRKTPTNNTAPAFENNENTNKPTSSNKASLNVNPQEQVAAENSSKPEQSRIDLAAGLCPPDRNELGRATWTFLHSVAAYYPATPTAANKEDARQLMHIVSRLYPCSDCAEDLRSDLVVDPPQLSSAVQFSKWMCQLHNRVNQKLGKPQFDCTRVFERWRDGWKDGSCD